MDPAKEFSMIFWRDGMNSTDSKDSLVWWWRVSSSEFGRTKEGWCLTKRGARRKARREARALYNIEMKRRTRFTETYEV